VSRALLYLPEVARDYTDALDYYEALSASAALKFDEAFSRAESDVESGLVTHQRVFEHYHRVFVGQFPYHLYYRLTDTHAVIVGVLYARFSPQRIEEKLRTRE
jgi:plasmid stabilization system protein ParE